MESINLLQSFGLTVDGRLVSVEDVSRGKACACCCSECGEVLIARQGEVRAWHFAHASGSECAGGAEGALHRAAKQLILEAGAILVPGLKAWATHVLGDGRSGESLQVRPAETWTLTEARAEVVVGDYRIDVVANHEGGPVFIEVTVTHAVDAPKGEALTALGVPCFEIRLDPGRYEAWSWEKLRREVLECADNREWIFNPVAATLNQAAQREAALQAVAKPNPTAAVPTCERFRLYGVPVNLTGRGWGLCLWSSYHDQVNGMVKAVAKSVGGRWNPKYRNWVIPVGAKSAVVAQLLGLGAVRWG